MRFRVAILAALLFVFSAPLFAQAATFMTNETVDFDFLVTSCSGEPVTFIGTAHVIQQGTGNQNGGHFFVHINFHLEGTSASGTRYEVNEQVNNIEVQNGATVFQSEAHLNAIATGPEDNLAVHTTIHFTVNANGEVTAESFEFEADCRG